MLALSVQEDHPGKMTQALVCVCLSACVQRVLRVALTEHSAFTELLPLILIRACTCMVRS